jgi:hypothetical protein
MTSIGYRLARAVWAPQFRRRIQTAWHLCEAIDLNRASPFFITIRITSTLSTLSTSSTSTFSTLLRLLSKIQRLTTSSVWRASCLYRTCKNVMQEKEALCHWFSYSAGGTSGTAFCGIARDSDSWIPCAMACGWPTSDRKVLS